jgi:hypothetical protein
MQDGCKVYTNSYMASNDPCFMVTWTKCKNHLLDVGLTHNRETMALRTLTTIDFILFYHVRGPAWIKKFIERAFGWGPGHTWLHTTLEGPCPHYIILKVCWNGLWTLFFWALTILWSRLLARVWSGPKYHIQCSWRPPLLSPPPPPDSLHSNIWAGLVPRHAH